MSITRLVWRHFRFSSTYAVPNSLNISRIYLVKIEKSTSISFPIILLHIEILNFRGVSGIFHFYFVFYQSLFLQELCLFFTLNLRWIVDYSVKYSAIKLNIRMTPVCMWMLLSKHDRFLPNITSMHVRQNGLPKGDGSVALL